MVKKKIRSTGTRCTWDEFALRNGVEVMENVIKLPAFGIVEWKLLRTWFPDLDVPSDVVADFYFRRGFCNRHRRLREADIEGFTIRSPPEGVPTVLMNFLYYAYGKDGPSYVDMAVRIAASRKTWQRNNIDRPLILRNGEHKGLVSGLLWSHPEGSADILGEYRDRVKNEDSE